MKSQVRFSLAIICVMLVFLTVVLLRCDISPDLSKKEKDTFYAFAFETGYSWGYQLIYENRGHDVFWTPPNRVTEAQKLNSQINIRDYYIPKGYWTKDDIAPMHFPDGTPFNNKQKQQVMDVNNWGFYDGFMAGSDDCLKHKPQRFSP
jgi:hypothetical protein